MSSCDACIVGGGVVGAALAVALSRAGLRTVLIERGARPKPWSPDDYDLRVFAMAPGSIAFLRSLGAWEHVTAQRASPYMRMRVWERDLRQGLSFDAAELRVAELGEIVEHDLLLEGIWQQLGDVDCRTGLAVAGLEIDDHGARLQLSDGGELTSRLVVAADGANSQLRELVGIDCLGWRYEQKAVVCHVRTERAHEGTAWQRFLPTGPLAFLPLADGRSSIVWSSTEADALTELDDDTFRASLGAASQYALGTILGCTRRVLFPLRMLHATEYTRPRFALVGDSAHVVHPLAGQGVNLGLSDAQALAEVLVTASTEGRDIGAARVLKRYERARKADNIDMLAVTDGLYRLFGLRAPGLDGLLETGMSLVNRLPLAKQPLMRRAIGMT